jgi:hypothetical protein
MVSFKYHPYAKSTDTLSQDHRNVKGNKFLTLLFKFIEKASQKCIFFYFIYLVQLWYNERINAHASKTGEARRVLAHVRASLVLDM